MDGGWVSFQFSCLFYLCNLKSFLSICSGVKILEWQMASPASLKKTGLFLKNNFPIFFFRQYFLVCTGQSLWDQYDGDIIFLLPQFCMSIIKLRVYDSVVQLCFFLANCEELSGGSNFFAACAIKVIYIPPEFSPHIMSSALF